MSSCRVIRTSLEGSTSDSGTPSVLPVTWSTLSDGQDENRSAAVQKIQPGSEDAVDKMPVSTDEAERILSNAHAQAVRIRQAAYEEGYEQGLKQAQDDNEAERRQVLETAQAAAQGLLDDAGHQRDQILRSLQGDIAEVVMQSVQALLHAAHVVERADVLGQVMELLETEVRGSNVEIRVHPDDLVSDELPLSLRLDGIDRVSLKPDDTLTRGGFVVQTDTQEIDATIETKLSLLKPKVQQWMGGLLDERAVGISTSLQTGPVLPGVRAGQ